MVILSVVRMDCPMAQCPSVIFAPKTCEKSEISENNMKDILQVFSRMAKIERKRGFAAHKEKDGTPIFLDELDPNRGCFVKEIIPECGLFCESCWIYFTRVKDIICEK